MRPLLSNPATSVVSRLFSLCFIGLIAACSNAEWAKLNSEISEVTFISVKNKDIAEVHRFDRISGSISDSGQVSLEIDPVSVATGIDIRNERMREHLFKVVEFPAIAINAQVDLDALGASTQTFAITAQLELLGTSHDVQADLLVTTTETQVQVSSRTPILVRASDLGLSEGVAKLAELAGGIPIGDAVPVNLALSFDR